MASLSISHAADVLTNYGIIAHQTDTIIGLACLPEERVLQRLQNLKLREKNKGFILLASSFNQIHHFVRADPSEIQTLNSKTKKPTTWLVNASDQTPVSLLGDTGKVAIRITQHPDVKTLCDQVGAIISTSANLSNQKTCLELNQVRAIFGPRIDFVQSHSTPGTGQSSTIIELGSGKVLRK